MSAESKIQNATQMFEIAAEIVGTDEELVQGKKCRVGHVGTLWLQ